MPPSIAFATGSTRLNARDLRYLSWVADDFRRTSRSGTRLLLEAQMDGTGSPVVNGRLARRRAEAVRIALIRRGVPANAIEIGTPSFARGGPNQRIVGISRIASSGCW
jgi:outer membrane protein OmpA-like peptidoglycan-associated protein